MALCSKVIRSRRNLLWSPWDHQILLRVLGQEVDQAVIWCSEGWKGSGACASFTLYWSRSSMLFPFVSPKPAGKWAESLPEWHGWCPQIQYCNEIIHTFSVGTVAITEHMTTVMSFTMAKEEQNQPGRPTFSSFVVWCFTEKLAAKAHLRCYT